VSVWIIAINPLTPTTLYAGTSVGIFRSTDSGDHWTDVNIGVTYIILLSLAIDPLTPTTLYAGTSVGIFRSTDSGDHWTDKKDYANLSLFSLAINPLTPSTLYAGIWNWGIFRSTDSGTTWTEVNTALTYTLVQCLAINPLTPTTLYAGTALGLFRYDAVTSYALTTTASPAAGGSIIRSPKAVSYAPGTVVTLTASPAVGYAFTGWSGALTGTKNPVTLKMHGDRKVTASFTKKTQSILQLTIGSTTMHVNGKPFSLEAAPIILNSRTLLPIRAVVEAAGGTIAWEASTQKVTVVRKGKTLELWIDRNVAKLNGQSVNIDSDPRVVPIIMSGRTLLPLRFVAEALALDVQWDSTTRTVTIAFTP